MNRGEALRALGLVQEVLPDAYGAEVVGARSGDGVRAEVVANSATEILGQLPQLWNDTAQGRGQLQGLV